MKRPEITQEKAWEYRQVAALLAMDIENLHDIVNHSQLDRESLMGHIEMLHGDMKKMTTDKEAREMRFDAASMIFNLPKRHPPDGPTDG